MNKNEQKFADAYKQFCKAINKQSECRENKDIISCFGCSKRHGCELYIDSNELKARQKRLSVNLDSKTYMRIVERVKSETN